MGCWRALLLPPRAEPRAARRRFCSRGAAALAVMPLTVVKTRIEAGDRTLGGTFTTMRAIYKADTLRGLYRGVLPTVLLGLLRRFRHVVW